jgi:transposase
VAEQRAHWHEQLAAEPAAQLVFVDESGANTKMTRLGGRAPIGERLVTHLPHGHYQTSTLIAAVRLAGACAPWLFEGAMDGEMFLAWVQQGLAPTLQPNGARLLYLPPYSPDFNPIENMWSKIKQLLRSLGPRTNDDLLQAAATAFAAVSPTDCQGFFFHAKYSISFM